MEISIGSSANYKLLWISNIWLYSENKTQPQADVELVSELCLVYVYFGPKDYISNCDDYALEREGSLNRDGDRTL